MTPHSPFVAAMAAAPFDHAPRAAAADLYRELGDEDRARFVEVQLQLDVLPGGAPGYVDLGREERDLLWKLDKALVAEPLRAAKLSTRRNMGRGYAETDPLPPFNLQLARGFGDRVVAPLSFYWEHRPCAPCNGTGLIPYQMPPSLSPQCRRCRGAGTVFGDAPTALFRLLVREEPVREVAVNDVYPDGYGGLVADTHPYVAHHLPAAVMAALAARPDARPLPGDAPAGVRYLTFPVADRFRVPLSDALIALARA